jgi:hypothetical protein
METSGLPPGRLFSLISKKPVLKHPMVTGAASAGHCCASPRADHDREQQELTTWPYPKSRVG